MVPFIFVLSKEGAGLLMHGPWSDIISTFVTACLDVVCLSAGFFGWLLGKANMVQRAILLTSGMLLIYPSAISDFIGFGGAVAAAVWQKVTNKNLKAGLA